MEGEKIQGNQEAIMFCPHCGKPLHKKKVWCDFTDEAKEIGYKMGGNGEQGEILGESRDKKGWRVRWSGIQTVYVYPKEYIKILD